MMKSTVAVTAFLISALSHAGCSGQAAHQQRSRPPSANTETKTRTGHAPDAVEQDRLSGEDHYARANNMANGEPEGALKEYNLAIEKGYDTVELRIQLGRVLAKYLKRPAEAVGHLHIATQRDEKNWRAHWSLALSLLETERFDEAFTEFTIARGLDPELGGFYGYYIGRALEGMGRYEDALINYREYLEHEERISSNAPEISEVKERIKAIREKMQPVQ